MPKREDERARDSGLRHCAKCDKWFTIKEWDYHYHNPAAIDRVLFYLSQKLPNLGEEKPRTEDVVEVEGVKRCSNPECRSDKIYYSRYHHWWYCPSCSNREAVSLCLTCEHLMQDTCQDPTRPNAIKCSKYEELDSLPLYLEAKASRYVPYKLDRCSQ